MPASAEIGRVLEFAQQTGSLQLAGKPGAIENSQNNPGMVLFALETHWKVLQVER